MSIPVHKYFRICLFVLIPIFLISNVESDFRNEESSVRASETLDSEAYGNMRFVASTETSTDGTKFSVLKLKLEDDCINAKNSFQLIISKEKTLGEIGPGSYRIAKDNEGLLNYLDGVFGFLNRKDSEELPFFAHFGEITITRLDDELVNGFLNIYLKNTAGDSVQIKGDFVALP